MFVTVHHTRVCMSILFFFHVITTTWLISRFNSFTYILSIAINRSLFVICYFFHLYLNCKWKLRKAKSNCVAPQFNILSYDWWWISSYFINFNFISLFSFQKVVSFCTHMWLIIIARKRGKKIRMNRWTYCTLVLCVQLTRWF